MLPEAAGADGIQFIIYAATFRLAVLACGIACVYMGFKLYVLGVMPKDGSEIDAQAGEIRLTLKNAAPGTVFAVFGVILIITMLLQGNPETTYKQQNTLTNGTTTTTEVSMRGERNRTLNDKAQEYFQLGQYQQAISVYGELLQQGDISLADAAEPITGVAEIYLAQNRSAEALTLLMLASQVDSSNAKALALQADALWQTGDKENAITAKRHAAKLDSNYQLELQAMLAE